MANYVLSNANRFYVATETAYGMPAPIAGSNRFAAFNFACNQSVEISKRRDKTGARTWSGNAAGTLRRSSFEISTHLVSWDGITQPACSPLVQAAMGGLPELVEGIVVETVSSEEISTAATNSLTVGSPISNGSEIRFVSSVQDSSHFNINAPFLATPGAGSVLASAIGFPLATQLPSVSLYDYWDPVGAVSRLVTGAGVDRFRISAGGDLHQLSFSGPAADVFDSVSAAYGTSGLTSFPAEPALTDFEYSIVGGQLGQVWLGSPLNQVFAITNASIEVNNNLLVRGEEFGFSDPTSLVPGPREIVSTFTLFSQPENSTQGLYTAAKTRTPVAALLQLGQQKGQMMAIYLPNVVPELPFFDDSEAYLLWEFKNNLAQGVSNDEIYLAFA